MNCQEKGGTGCNCNVITDEISDIAPISADSININCSCTLGYSGSQCTTFGTNLSFLLLLVVFALFNSFLNHLLTLCCQIVPQVIVQRILYVSYLIMATMNVHVLGATKKRAHCVQVT